MTTSMNIRTLIITLLACACVIAITPPCLAQADYVAKVKSDLESATSRLNAQRTKLNVQQIELSSQITALQQELLTKRRQADLSRRSAADNQAFLQSLKNKELASSRAAQSLNDALKSYGIKQTTKRFPGEDQDHRLDAAFTKSGTPNELIQSRLIAIESGLSRLEASMGGATYQGTVTDSSARVIQGSITTFGPARWFVSEDGEHAGRYNLSPSWQTASLHPSGSDTAKALTAGKVTLAAIDISGGKAQALADIKSNPIDLVIKGGLWVYPILLIGLTALVCAVLKIRQLRSIHQPKEQLIAEIISQYSAGNKDTARSQASKISHPIAQVLPDCIDAAEYGIEVVEEVLYERMITIKESLRRWLPFIATTAAIAPLLGLLGTVSGLIRTFSVIAIEGTGEAQSISGGISEALITTLFGLAIAIPAFMAHALLSRMAKGIEQNTERLSLKFINALRQLPATAPPASHGQ